MTEGRMVSTSQAASRLGFPSVNTFLRWVRTQEGFPRPERKHHLWWDFKAIEQYLDKKSGVPQNSFGWKEKFLRALNGEDNRAVPH